MPVTGTVTVCLTVSAPTTWRKQTLINLGQKYFFDTQLCPSVLSYVRNRSLPFGLYLKSRSPVFNTTVSNFYLQNLPISKNICIYRIVKSWFSRECEESAGLNPTPLCTLSNGTWDLYADSPRSNITAKVTLIISTLSHR